jgi:hypothetical protein
MCGVIRLYLLLPPLEDEDEDLETLPDERLTLPELWLTEPEDR